MGLSRFENHNPASVSTIRSPFRTASFTFSASAQRLNIIKCLAVTVSGCIMPENKTSPTSGSHANFSIDGSLMGPLYSLRFFCCCSSPLSPLLFPSFNQEFWLILRLQLHKANMHQCTQTPKSVNFNIYTVVHTKILATILQPTCNKYHNKVVRNTAPDVTSPEQLQAVHLLRLHTVLTVWG